MKRAKFLKLRDAAYKLAGEVGTLTEISNARRLHDAYARLCEGLDSIDGHGYDLGILDPETNDILPVRRKRKGN